MPVNATTPVVGLPQATPAVPAAAAAPAPVVAAPEAAKPEEAKAATPADTNKVASSTGEQSTSSLPPSSSSTPAEKVKGFHTSSVGDPHETTADGLKFDNMKTGVFVKMRAKSGDFELQTRQDPWDRNPQATVNTAAAVKVNKGGDIVKVDAAKDTITFNGKPIEVKEGEKFEIPGGGSITKSGKGYEITSAAGDKVTTHDRGTYMDITADASPERVDGDVSGSLGALDSDTDMTNDFVARDGKQMDVNNTDAFIEEWRAKGEEDMFGEKPAGGAVEAKPADGEAKPVEGEVKPVEGEAKPAEGDDKALTDIKANLAKLKADPANAQFADLFAKLEELLGGAAKGEEKPAADLQQQVNEAKPEGNAGIEELLKMIMAWLEEERQKRDIANKAKEGEAKAVAA